MAHCININSPDYKELVKQTTLGQRELKARIATWQELHNEYDRYPSASEVEGLLNAPITTPAKVFDLNEALSDAFPTSNITELSYVVSNIIENNKAHEGYFILKDAKVVQTKMDFSKEYKEAFISLLNTVTSPAERSFLYDKYAPWRVPSSTKEYSNHIRFFDRLAERYFEHNYKTNAIKEGNDLVSSIFDRISALGNISLSKKDKDSITFLDIIRRTNDSLEHEFNTDSERYKKDTETNQVLLGDISINAPEVRNTQALLQKRYPRQRVTVQAFNDTANPDIKDGKKGVKISVQSPKAEDYSILNRNNYSPETLVKLNNNIQKYFGEEKVSSAQRLLSILADEGSLLAKYLSRALTVDIPIVLENTMFLHSISGISKTASGTYSTHMNMITLSISGVQPRTIIHEILHGLTSNYLNNNGDSPLVKDFIKVYEYAISIPEIKAMYGGTNSHEFIAELFSNKAFQRKLAKYPARKDVKKYPNLLRQIFDKILSWLGLNTDSTLLEQAYAVGSNVLEDASNWMIDQNPLNNLSNNVNYEMLNEDFGEMPEEIDSGNPVSNALRRLNAQYTPSEIQELSKTISVVFSDMIDYSEEDSPELNRKQVINKETTKGLMEQTYETLKYELSLFEKAGHTYYANNLKKLLNNFWDLSLVSLPIIEEVEGIKFDMDGFQTFSKITETELDSGVSQDNEMSEQNALHEEQIREGWQVNHMHTSVRSSLSPKVKKFIRSLDEYSGTNDKDGNPLYVINSVGYVKKMDPGIVEKELREMMQDVTVSSEFMPALRNLAENKPYFESLVDALEDDPELEVQFYRNFQKHHNKYGVTKSKVKSDGTISFETMIINTTDDTTPLLESWKNNLEKGVSIGGITNSIYSGDNRINTGNASNNIKILKSLLDGWASTLRGEPTIDGIKYTREGFVKAKTPVILKQLQAVGISIDLDELQSVLQDAVAPNIQGKKTFNITKILERLSDFNKWAEKATIKDTIDIYNENKGNYNFIANLVVKSIEDTIEGGVQQSGKNYWSFLKPNYLTKFIRQLKNPSDTFLYEEFQQFGLLYKNGRYNIHWLNQLYGNTGKKYQDLLDTKINLALDRSDYDSLTDTEYYQMLLADYFSGEKTAWFHVPIMAEAPVSRAIKFEKITTNYKTNIPAILADTTFMYEWERIKVVRARQEGIANGTILPIKNFDYRGLKFQMFPYLNGHMETIEKLDNEKKGAELLTFVEEKISEYMEKAAKEDIKMMQDIGILDYALGDEKSNKYTFLTGFRHNGKPITPKNKNAEEALTEYFYNSYLATVNMIQLTSTDMSYFDGIVDFQKRNKQINAPGESLYTQATYNGERIGKDLETYVVLSDQYTPSSKEVLNLIDDVLENNKVLSRAEKDRIKKLYESNNITDAQAFRSLDSVRTVIAMYSGWNDNLEGSFQRLKNGQFSMADYDNIFQAFKPFVYTQNRRDAGLESGIQLKVPTQHKNAEVILLPTYAAKSPKLNGILQAMNDPANPIDVVMFESAVKVGLQGHLDINEMNNSTQIAKYITSFKDNPEVYKTISYEDYRIQQPVPEHLQDAEGLYGTQTRALLMADTTESMQFTLPGRKDTIDGKTLRNLYDNTILENLLESYEGAKEDFSNPRKVQNILQNEILGNTRYSRDLLHALSLRKDGKFILPVFDQSQANRIEQLFNSIWKSRITKQKIKGGKAVNMTSYGVDNQLSLKWSRDSEGRVHIEYMEAYLPFPTDKLPEVFNNTNGVVEVEELLSKGIIDEEFLQLVGYRIPTEAHYSTWPIKVKGFLPRNGGGNIVLPREITTIVGLDFDVDSLYFMMKEFTVKEDIDWNAAHDDFTDATGITPQNIDERRDLSISQEFVGEESPLGTYKEEFNKWFASNKNKYVTKRYLKTVKPDLSKDPKDMSRKERNNLLIDITTSVLTHPEMAVHNLNPGNFDLLKASSRRLNLLNDPNNKLSWEELEKMSLPELKKLDKDNDMDILRPSSQVSLFKKNMTAAKLIGIIANHVVHHAIRQNTNTSVSPIVSKDKLGNLINIPRFKVNGKFYTNLHASTTPDGKEYISKNYASNTASAVDAVKDPVLDSMNYNIYTADIAMLLVGLGYNSNEIGLLLRQPMVMEAITRVERDNIPLNTAIEDLISKYKDIVKDSYKREWNFLNKDMAINIHIGAVLRSKESNTFSPEKVQDYYNFQISVLENLLQITKVSNTLATFVKATRAHTGNGGAGPTMADNMMNMRKVLKHQLSASKGILLDSDVIHTFPSSYFENIDLLREELRKEKLGFAQGFITLGWQATEHIFSKFFPYYKGYYNYIINTIENQLDIDDIPLYLMKSLLSDFQTYYMSQFEGFTQEDADYFINKFPNDFIEMKNSDPELSKLSLIKDIKFDTPNLDVPVAKLRFRAGGRLSDVQRDQRITEWESLLYHPKYKELAFNLFKYNFFVNGLAFGATSFTHLAPTMLKVMLPGFTDNLYKLLDASYWNQLSTFDESIFTPEQINSIVNNPEGTIAELPNDREELQVGDIRYAEIHGQTYKTEVLDINSENSTYTMKLIPVENGTIFKKEHLDMFIDQWYRNRLDNRTLVPTWENAPLEKLKKVGEVPTIITLKSLENVFNENAPYVKANGKYYKIREVLDQNKESTENIEGLRDYIIQEITPLGIKNNFLTYSFGESNLKTGIKSQIEYDPVRKEQFNLQDNNQEEVPPPLSKHDNKVYDYSDYDDLTLGDPDLSREVNNSTNPQAYNDYMNSPVVEKSDTKVVNSGVISSNNLKSNTTLKNNTYNNITIQSNYYTKNTTKDKSKGFLFTENLQAYLANRNRESEVNLNVSNNNLKLDVTANNNQAGIRQTNNIPNKNAFAIISKKAQQDNGKWLHKEGQFQDTNTDFQLFKKYNIEAIQEAKNSNLPLNILQGGIATGKSALPLRFAEWLNNYLQDELGVSGTISKNSSLQYDGYGIFNIQKSNNSILEYKQGELFNENDFGEVVEEVPFSLEDSSIVKEIVPDSLQSFVNHSGGAVGADTAWDTIGKEFGMINSKHYFVEGNKTPNGNSAISIKEAKEADVHLIKANKSLQRKFPTSKEYVNNLLRRNWFQVKNSDAIFAIGSLISLQDTIVNGGTGWAVQMALDNNKPVYLYDQQLNKWFLLDKSSSNYPIEFNSIPTLTPNFAGIGTREINNNGRQAIRDVYQKTTAYLQDINQFQKSNIAETTNTWEYFVEKNSNHKAWEEVRKKIEEGKLKCN